MSIRTASTPSARVAGAVLLALIPLTGCAGSQASLPPVSEGPAEATQIGESRESRPILARRLGTGGERLAVIANIHGNENEGLRHLDDIVELLADAPWDVLLIEDVNPDGTATQRRTTGAGVDPNRNWPATNFEASAQCGPEPLSEPGVAATHAALASFDPALVVVLHSTRRGPFVNYDGPAEAPARAFAEAAGSPWRVQPSMGYPTPGSLGTWMGVDREVPILTIEFRRACPPEESRPALLAGLGAIARGETARGGPSRSARTVR